MSDWEKNKIWLYPLLIFIIAAAIITGIYFGLNDINKDSSQSSSSTITTPPPKNYFAQGISAFTDSGNDNINVARAMDVSGITNGPEPSVTPAPTINPKQKCWNALKNIVPSELYSQIQCANINITLWEMRSTIRCIIAKLISKNMNINGNLDMSIILDIYKNSKLCEQIGAIIFIDLLSTIIERGFKTELNDRVMSFFMKSDEQNFEKVFSWNNQTSRIQVFGSLKNELSRIVVFLNNMVLGTETVVALGRNRVVSREFVSTFKSRNIDIEKDISTDDFARIIIPIFLVQGELTTQCEFCRDNTVQNQGTTFTPGSTEAS